MYITVVLAYRGGTRLQPGDFDLHWWVDRSQAATTELPLRPLEPRVERQRRTESRRHVAGSGINGSRRELSMFERLDGNIGTANAPTLMPQRITVHSPQTTVNTTILPSIAPARQQHPIGPQPQRPTYVQAQLPTPPPTVYPNRQSNYFSHTPVAPPGGYFQHSLQQLVTLAPQYAVTQYFYQPPPPPPQPIYAPSPMVSQAYTSTQPQHQHQGNYYTNGYDDGFRFNVPTRQHGYAGQSNFYNG